MVSVAGRAQSDNYESRDGEKRRALQVIADSVIASRTVRWTGIARQPRGGLPEQIVGALLLLVRPGALMVALI